MAKRKPKLDKGEKLQRTQRVYAIMSDISERMGKETNLLEIAICKSKLAKYRAELKELQRSK